FLKEQNKYQSYFNIEEYLAEDKNQIVVDYMASMTDDYFVELYHYLFPTGKYGVEYKGYF
ncbi:MAG: phosphohydrolase, partial [Lachnospiraceae bacterium]|nr:phosphohydrolase [Lachnospiraceae bacterium]